MKIPQQNQNPKTPYLNYMVYILWGLFLFLGTYIWIHHQTLTMTEEKINHYDQILPKIEEKINHYNQIFPQIEEKINNYNQILPRIEETKKEIMTKFNDFIQSENKNQEQSLLENNNPFHQNNTELEGRLFHPSDSKKFIGFDKLIGFKEEKKAIDGFIDYLKNSENYQGIGEVEPPLGILMYGCPGTGKTTLARALAKETNLPFFEVSSSVFAQKFRGTAVQMVRDLFTAARILAEEQHGAIIFLDECETIFSDISLLDADSELANVVNQFKTEMTSMDNNPNKPIFIIGATNYNDRIDDAIKSRFTYNIEVKPGNKAERQQMLEFLIKKRKNPYNEEAKHYLLEVINEALEYLPDHQQFLKANRTLENLLKTTVSIFAPTRGTSNTRRNEINKNDLKQAYQMIISPDLSLLEQIENQLISKGGEK
ncbi:MAG: AAA family ATPase [Candidatus Phytoplasma stylosanthis]|uniref:AAA family ATPase n=1 Tax=Candidatus Phytoplasma stylosanthis TaxID=2798314 RepID=UPI00293ADE96|nr:AAA family ATPase [Candidatus Phytoplasma stylosanthis]MDV3168207.1 AAA family ATPase [Candidatus Phytoplasma stylosanthis]